MIITENIYNKIFRIQSYLAKLAKIDVEITVRDLLDNNKPKEQIEILKQYIPENELRGKRLLEIGSGPGIFNFVARKDYGIEAWGIEPGSEGFDGFYEISREFLEDNGMESERIIKGIGENIPFADEEFDIVYSTNVLEHVDSPEKVLSEAIRVCRPGGVIQIVAPNYGSFFDGHYACFYFPYQPKWFWKIWLRYILKRDPNFVDTLRTNINFFSMRKWLKPHLKNIKIISFGEEVFKERMKKNDFSAWAGLRKVKKWIGLIHRLKLVRLASFFLVSTRAYNPIILTLKKNEKTF